MKRLFNTALLFLSFTFACYAQTWYPANNPYGGHVLSMHETADGDLLSGTGRGLYRSTDNGENWQSISGEYQAFSVPDVTSTSSGMYICTFGPYLRRSFDDGQNWEDIPAQNWTSLNKIVVNDNDQIFLKTNNSVWRSSDNGDTWAQLTIDVNVSSLLSLEISPDGELFAGTYNSKVYRSNDNGDTWTEIYTASADLRTFGFDGNDIIYAGTLFSGMYKSVDNGDNWTLLPALPGADGALDVEVNSSGEVFIAAFEEGVLTSTDGGTTWTNITADLLDPSARKIFLNSSEELFVGTEAAGVQKKVGASWSAKNQGINAVTIERFVSIDGILYACTGSGVFISNDGGTSWQQSLQGMDDTEILALAKAPNGDLYAGGEMLYYTQDGINWNNISSGFPDSEVYATDILIEASGRVIVATDEYGIRFTEDQGQSWTYANAGLDDVTMAFIRKNANGYFFTADGYNLYRSNDLSGSWEEVNTGLTDTDITEFGISTSALFAITYSDGLFKSTDNGDNWSLSIDQNFENVTMNGNDVYAASDYLTTGGVYYSSDNGGTWSNIGGGLPGIPVEEVNYVLGLGLFANLDEYGLYTLDFSVVGLNEFAESDNQLQCFPNPFSGSTTIRIDLEENAEVSYAIHGLRGELIDRSTPFNLATGTHDLNLGNDLPPGVYLVTVDTGYSLMSVRLVKTE